MTWLREFWYLFFALSDITKYHRLGSLLADWSCVINVLHCKVEQIRQAAQWVGITPCMSAFGMTRGRPLSRNHTDIWQKSLLNSNKCICDIYGPRIKLETNIIKNVVSLGRHHKLNKAFSGDATLTDTENKTKLAHSKSICLKRSTTH